MLRVRGPGRQRVTDTVAVTGLRERNSHFSSQTQITVLTMATLKASGILEGGVGDGSAQQHIRPCASLRRTANS
eukprot:3321098-Prymnesium_polylepis.1